MFYEAIKNKYRFPMPGGNIGLEDLCDLPLLNNHTNRDLKTVAMTLARKLKEVDTENFIGEVTPEDTITERKLSIVKHVIADKKAIASAYVTSIDNKAHNAKIDALIADKQDEALKGLSAEDLKKLKR